MSDSPAFGFALGYLAAGPATETAANGALMLTRALRIRQEPQLDSNNLLTLVQEQEQYIAQQQEAIARLTQVGLEWQQYGKNLKAKHTKLEEWADWAERELKKREDKA